MTVLLTSTRADNNYACFLSDFIVQTNCSSIMASRRVVYRAWSYTPSLKTVRGLAHLTTIRKFQIRGFADEGVTRDLMTGEFTSLPDIEVCLFCCPLVGVF